MMVRLIDINPNNWRLPLKVTAEQQSYVATTAGILARAYAYRKQRSRAFVVYDEDVPVGMGLYYDCPELESYEFSQLFVDARYQGRGYGKAAMGLVLEAMKQDGRYDKVVLCYIQGNRAAQKLYENLGFRAIGQEEEEILMEKRL